MYNLLIADDDSIILEGVRKYLMKNFPQIGAVWTAKNGQEAFSVFEAHKPDIIFTDVAMPIIDGLELIDRLHQNGYHPKTVIISAYENFSYAQNAMRLGVEDYLIKPIMPDQIRAVTAKLLAELEDHQAFLDNINDIMNTYKESLPLLRQRFFNALVQENADTGDLMEKARQVNIDLTGKTYTTAVLKVESAAPGAPNHPAAADVFARLLTSASGKIFPDGIRVYNFVDNGSNVVLIAISDRADTGELFRLMNESLDRLMDSVKKRSELSIENAALGRQYDTLQGISRSYREALDVLISADGTRTGSVCNYADISINRESGIRIDPALESSLLHSVKYQTYDLCLRLVDQLEAQISNYRYSHFDSIKTYYLQLSVLMWREYQQISGGKTDMRADFDGLISASGLEACLAWFRVFVRSLVEKYRQINEEQGHWLVNRAMCIIQDNIPNSDFSLNDVASALYVSSNYLRRLFKQQSNESFVEYLTRIRMEKATDLLKNTNMKIQEIAEVTGYSNQRYFAVCFKKHYGKTPTSIREKAV